MLVRAAALLCKTVLAAMSFALSLSWPPGDRSRSAITRGTSCHGVSDGGPWGHAQVPVGVPWGTHGEDPIRALRLGAPFHVKKGSF